MAWCATGGGTNAEPLRQRTENQARTAGSGAPGTGAGRRKTYAGRFLAGVYPSTLGGKSALPGFLGPAGLNWR